MLILIFTAIFNPMNSYIKLLPYHRCYLIYLFLLTFSSSYAQYTWSDHTAAIFYNNCTSCHNPNGIGGFSLVDYDIAYNYRRAIKVVIETNFMPPWTADPAIGHYAGERILSEEEKSQIIAWIDQGCIKGDESNAPPPPVYNNKGFIQKKPDYEVQIPPYRSKAQANKDDYVCFAIPTDLPEDKIIKAIEIIPGNVEIVHHALLFIDPDGTSQTDTVGGDCGGPQGGYLVTGYVPGSTPTVFPSSDHFNSGMRLPKGSKVVLAMHYPNGSQGMLDSTKVRFFFYDEITRFREISSGPLIQDWSLYFPPNQKKKVKASFPKNGTLTQDYTLLSTFPHMHLLGRSIRSYFINNRDTTHLISIPEWDFEWQDFYFFRFMKKIPRGSQLFGEAWYDNTVNNRNNPNDPPKAVKAGLNTTDEMFLIYFHYMDYMQGDETINVDSLNQDYLTSTISVSTSETNMKIFPNPANEKVHFEYELAEKSTVSLFIYDQYGRLVRRLVKAESQSPGQHKIVWELNNGQQRLPGIYYYSMRINNQLKSGPLVIYLLP